MRTWTRLALVAAAGAVAAAGVLASAQPADSADSQQDRLAKADAIAARVSQTRGLSITRKIDRGVMSKAEIRARLLSRIDQEYKPEELAAEELAMKRMGMLPPDADYKKLVIDLLSDQIAGFYDPWERRLFIANWNTTGVAMMDDAVMAHEIDHALQDQHFNLRKFMTADAKNADATTARQALVEGDGMALMVEYLGTQSAPPAEAAKIAGLLWASDAVVQNMKQLAAANMGGLAQAPLVLREGLVFPYTGGLEFVAHLRKTQPWSAVDAAFRKPPLATEQIMHPAKYDAYERPDQVTASTPAALRGWKLAYQNVSGELGVLMFLRQHGVASQPADGSGRADLAAAGWGGDRLAVFTPPGGGKAADAVGVFYTVWDHEADAIEFFAAAADAVPVLAGTKATLREPTYLEHAAGDKLYTVERKGDAVVLLVGAPADKAADLRAQVWAWKVKRG